VLSYLRSKYYE
jgi:hypothetical protein